VADYFFGLDGFSGSCSGLAFGRPFPGEFLMASKTSGEYKASCEIGLYPPLNILISTVRLGIFNAFAISLIVIPSMLQLSVIIDKHLKNVNILLHLLYKCVDKITNISIKVDIKSLFILTKCDFISTIKS